MQELAEKVQPNRIVESMVGFQEVLVRLKPMVIIMLRTTLIDTVMRKATRLRLKFCP